MTSERRTRKGNPEKATFRAARLRQKIDESWPRARAGEPGYIGLILRNTELIATLTGTPSPLDALTPTQAEVIRLRARGYSPLLISRRLGITVHAARRNTRDALDTIDVAPQAGTARDAQ